MPSALWYLENGDNSVGQFGVGQFGVSSSLLLPLDNSVSVHHSIAVPWGQFGVSSSLLLPLHQVGKLGDNSVSVHHYCFPCIKSVSWIHGKTSKTDRR